MNHPVLKLTCWNVNGLFKRVNNYCMLEDPLFLKAVSDFHIVGLIETHAGPEDSVGIPGYKAISYFRPKSNRAVKHSGGITILIKNDTLAGIDTNVRIGEHAVWVRLRKDYFCTVQDTFLAMVYLPPENSTFVRKMSEDIIFALEEEVKRFSASGQIILMGDLNGRMAREEDFVLFDSDKFIPNDLPYISDLHIPSRVSQDEMINPRGKDLVDLCIGAKLRVVNGRKPGDSMGYFTCHRFNGSSVVDYCILSESLFKDVISFHVHPLMGDLSDHCQISCNLCWSFQSQEQPIIDFKPLPTKFKWNEESPGLFQQALCSEEIQNKLNQFMSNTLGESMDCIDRANDYICKTILCAADKSLKKSKAARSRGSKHRNAKWFTNELGKLRRQVQGASRLLSIYPRDPIIRGNHYRLLKMYRTACRRESRSFKASLIKSLDDLYDTNPKSYWRMIDEIKNHKRDQSLPDPARFFAHFQSLNNKNTEMTVDRKLIKERLDQLEKTVIFNELDFKITDTEVTKAIKQLKTGKSSGMDQISNEMLKAGQSRLLAPLCKLFNGILTSGRYPSQWASGRIMSLHKKGDVSDPANYRGITMSSCLGKLFNSILNSRLYAFMEKNNIIPQEQIGFKRNHRTADHIFILKNLLESYKKKRKQLFLCFVDFKQAFDTVWHIGLLYKMAESGISSGMFRIIKDMYSKINICIQSGHSVSPFFSSIIGVRQGDNLSPTLFNLFLRDLPGELGTNCLPVIYGDMKLACLLYADDLVLLSESAQGLQQLLDRLESYSNLWALEVNTSKTKTLYIGPKRPSASSIECTYNAMRIEEVESFRYLGILISNDLSFKTTMKDIYHRGLKVYFKLMRSFQPQPKVETMIHLFDHLIKPVLLYGADVFGYVNLHPKEPKISADPKTQFYQRIRKVCPVISAYLNADYPLEKLHLKFCRRILQVHSKTVNLGVYGDLGRVPIFLDQAVHAMQYFYHLILSDDNRILKSFFRNVERLGDNKFMKFAQAMHNIVGISIPSNAKHASRNISRIKKHLYKEFQVYWWEMTNTNFAKSKNGNNKLRSYREYKNIFKREKYIQLCDPVARKYIAQIRLSAHKLSIESGRYNTQNQYIPPAERICRNCNRNEIEDEMHFILDCPAYGIPRENLLDLIKTDNVNFTSYNPKQKFIWIMSNENLDHLKALGKYITQAMLIRK